MHCSVPGCDAQVKYKGLCGKHYKRQWRHGDPEATLINMSGFRDKCAVAECNEGVRYPSTGMCNKHHTRLTRYGRTNRQRAEHGLGRPVTGAGYIVITRNGRPIYEHVYLAELALGKPLPKGAVVHHMNEDKTDNFTPFNLVVCPDQSYHALLHKRMREYAEKGYCTPELTLQALGL